MEHHGFIKLAAASPRLTLADPAANAQEILSHWRMADSSGALCIVFPELSLTGATCGDLFLQQGLQTAALGALETLLKESAALRTVALVGLPLMAFGRLYNVSVLLGQGRLIAATPRFPDARQLRWFARYDGTPRVITCLGRPLALGINIVPFDQATIGIAFDIDGLLSLPRGGANALLMPTAIPAAAGEYGQMREFLRQVAGIGHSALCYAGAGTGESTGDGVYAGEALIMEGPQLLAATLRYQSGGQMVLADVDIGRLSAERQAAPGFGAIELEYSLTRGLEPPRYEPEIHFTRALDPHPFYRDEPAFFEDAFQIQTAGLVRRAEASGAKKLVVAVSGGADSSLALLVAHRAARNMGWGPERVIGITMPGFGTGGGTSARAERLMQALNISCRHIDITNAASNLLSDMGHDGKTTDIAYENVQARVRTLLALNIANMEGALQVATGDLSEAALGWCTLGGDQIGMYNVNAGIPKTMLLGMLRWYAFTPGNEDLREVLMEVLDAPISPELIKDEQGVPLATEDTLGPYPLHDFYLYHTLTSGAPKEKLLFLARRAFKGAYDDDMIEKTLHTFLRRFVTQQFKRTSMPEGPAVLDVSLSTRGGWEAPGDASPSSLL